MNILFYLVAFIVTISILVAVHEFGHFWVARRLGVKVLRFSIGFGKPLWKRTAKDGTEYVIGMLPLGGYVKMLGENNDGQPLKEEEKHLAHDNQSVYTRFAIALAGPVFNFLFAIFAYWLLFVIGISGIKPIVGEITAGQPAAIAGMQMQDEILQVGDKRTPTWTSAIETMLPDLLDHEPISLRVRGVDGYERDLTLLYPEQETELKPEKLFAELGFSQWHPAIKPVLAYVEPDSAADKAGLRENDKILVIDGKPVPDWRTLVEMVEARPEQQVVVVYERDSKQIEVAVDTQQREFEGKMVGKLGVRPVLPDIFVTHQYPPFEAVGKALIKTWDSSVFMVISLGKIATGKLSLKNLSGPINIARYAGDSARLGFPWFLKFLAIVSISLAVLNLLPIPILDGGHLMYYLIEMVKGSPVSESVMEVGFRIGIVMLLLLMSVAFYNDIMGLLA